MNDHCSERRGGSGKGGVSEKPHPSLSLRPSPPPCPAAICKHAALMYMQVYMYIAVYRDSCVQILLLFIERRRKRRRRRRKSRFLSPKPPHPPLDELLRVGATTLIPPPDSLTHTHTLWCPLTRPPPSPDPSIRITQGKENGLVICFLAPAVNCQLQKYLFEKDVPRGKGGVQKRKRKALIIYLPSPRPLNVLPGGPPNGENKKKNDNKNQKSVCVFI